MRKLLGVMLSAGAILGAAACGASNNTDASATTYVITAPGGGTRAVTTAANPAGTGTKASTRHVKIGPAPHVAHVKPILAVKSHESPNRPDMSTKSHVKGPSAIACLRYAGLLNPHVVSPGEASGRSGATGFDVIAEGPFKTRAAAASAGASLQGLETIQVAGLYMVSARRSGHLQNEVRLTAKCLRGARGVGFLTF